MTGSLHDDIEAVNAIFSVIEESWKETWSEKCNAKSKYFACFTSLGRMQVANVTVLDKKAA